MSNKPIPASKMEHLQEWPCDGVKRFKVGVRTELAYSEAYEEVFRDSGGTVEPEAAPGAGPTRIHTRDSLRRLALLNLGYGPSIARFKAEKAVQFGQAKAVVGTQGNCPICRGKIEEGKILVCLACWDALPEVAQGEIKTAFSNGDKARIEGVIQGAIKGGHPRVPSVTRIE